MILSTWCFNASLSCSTVERCITTPGRQHHEDLSTAEQERDALKHQVDSIMKILAELNKREMH
jgi:hypothetical protein